VGDFVFSDSARHQLQSEGIPIVMLPELEEAASMYVAIRVSELSSPKPPEVAKALRLGIRAAVTRFYPRKGGRPRETAQRTLAADVADVFYAYDLPVNDSILGPFVAVLQVIFDEAGGPPRGRNGKPIGGRNVATDYLYPIAG